MVKVPSTSFTLSLIHILQHYYGIGLYSRDAADQFVLTVRHFHMGSVKSFRFKGIRKPCEDHRGLCLPRLRDRFFYERLIHFIRIIPEAFRQSDISPIFDALPCACLLYTSSWSPL